MHESDSFFHASVLPPVLCVEEAEDEIAVSRRPSADA
jgi:hypothetical protein